MWDADKSNLRCEELSIFFTRHLSGEIFRRQLVFISLGCVFLQLFRLLIQQLESVLLVDLLPLGGGNTVSDPLPQLRSGHFGGGGVFHQVIDWDTANAAQPTLHVSQTDVEILADTVFGDAAGNVHVEQIVGIDVDIFPSHVQLVGSRHVFVEDFSGDLSQSWMGNPSTVVAGAHFTEFVLSDGVHGLVVRFFVVLDRDLGGHASHGVHTASMAGFDEESHVCVHEWDGHGHGGTIGQDELAILSESLDHREDVIPSTTVEARGVITEFVDDLSVTLS